MQRRCASDRFSINLPQPGQEGGDRRTNINRCTSRALRWGSRRPQRGKFGATVGKSIRYRCRDRPERGRSLPPQYRTHRRGRRRCGRQPDTPDRPRLRDGNCGSGFGVLLAVSLIVGGWAALMPLAGAVVVPGNLVVQSNVKAIQHPTGGVVAEIAGAQRPARGRRRPAAAARCDPGAGQPAGGEQTARRNTRPDRPPLAERDGAGAACDVPPNWRLDRAKTTVKTLLIVRGVAVQGARQRRVEARSTSCKAGSRNSANRSPASTPRSTPRPSNWS